MDFNLLEHSNILGSIPAELDASEEVGQVMDFTLQGIEREYGFEGVGIQIIDHDKKTMKFYKLHIPSLPPERLKEMEEMELPFNIMGGTSFFVAQMNLTLYFEDIQEIDFDPNYASQFDIRSLQLLEHRTTLIIPVSFDGKVIAIIHLSSYTKTVSLTTEEIERIKLLCSNIGKALYKTLTFKKVYEEKQQLLLDIIKAQKSRDIFLAGINHELKTPLNAILGFSEYLSKTKKADLEKIHKMGGIIYRNGKHLLSIIHEIIEVYKIHSGKINIELNEVPVNQLIEEVVHSLSPLSSKKKQNISVKEERVHLKSDYKRLSQILYNLLSNAIKYTGDEGKIEIRVKSTEGHVVIEVCDNGIGMDSEDMENLFVPFKRGKTAYTEEEGSGLGLFITSQLVQVLGGNIQAHSELGKGSTFTVILPLEVKQFVHL